MTTANGVVSRAAVPSGASTGMFFLFSNLQLKAFESILGIRVSVCR